MARDYKHAKNSGSSMSAGAGFFWGLLVGLAVAGGVHFYHLNIIKKQKVQLVEEESPAKNERTPASQKSEQQQQFDFYEELPKYQVVVPEKDKQANRNATPDAHIDKAGPYTLQAGSYRNYADADRVRAMLALQGVESKIVKATVDADTWHRVRIGPLRDASAVEEVRRKLREVQIDAIVVRGE
jgi:cell division protein FtsN